MKKLIIAHNKTLASQLYGEFKEFFQKNAAEYFAVRMPGDKMSDFWCFLVPNRTDFADETAGYGLGDTRRTNGMCDFLWWGFVMGKKNYLVEK